ncbi:MAG TPA: RES domain-containing protein, partial [Bryobacteraceae bacterium]
MSNESMCALLPWRSAMGGFNVFYDEFERIALWGTYLHESLDVVYRTQSDRVIVFISKEYLETEWTRVEIRSALAGAFANGSIYILPVRFDATEIPGILPSLVYLNVKDFTPAQLARAVAQKLRPPRPAPPADAELTARTLWRLVKRRYAEAALNGEGARITGTRWTSPGRRVVYFASSQSVALLEVAAYVQVALEQFSLISARFDVPTELSRLYFDYSALAPGWAQSNPAWFRSFGDGWLDASRTAVLAVPSLVVNH